MMEIPQTIAAFLKKPIGVLGHGVSGQSVAAFLDYQQWPYVVYSENSMPAEGVEVFTQEAVDRHDLFVVSPGFAQQHPWMEWIIAKGKTWWGELDFSALFWQGELVAITGTNGKTTITDFIDQVFSHVGLRSIAVGNIGKPLSQVLPYRQGQQEIAVCEVSSFQAEVLHFFHPRFSIWTNFTEDHLDRYQTMEAYFDAKWPLVVNTREGVWIGQDVFDFAQKMGKEIPETVHVLQYDREYPVPHDSPFEQAPQRKNFQIASALLLAWGVDAQAINEVASTFRLQSHRLHRVGSWRHLTFWNDSKATNFGSVTGALECFDGELVWLGGGADKGGNAETLVASLLGRVTCAVVFGATAIALEKACLAYGLPCQRVADIEEAVVWVVGHVEGESDVLLSPGFASFDQFENYASRGNFFEETVLRLLEKENVCIKNK